MASAAFIELIAILFWPTLDLVDSSLEASTLSEMVRRRLGFVGAITDSAKSLVDWIFPGALWSWEQLVTFFFHLLILAFVAYALAAWSATHSSQAAQVPLRWVLIPLVVFEITLALTPATLSTDIYNYAIYGEMPVTYGANPFIRTPGEFPQSALYYLIPTYWHDAPSVYGPLWIALSAGVAKVFQSHALIEELLTYRFLAATGHFVNTVLIWHIARRLRPSSGLSAALTYAWNPAALLEFALNGHNDVFMLTLWLAAILLGLNRRPRLAALALGGSIAVKYTSALVAPLLLIALSVAAVHGQGLGRTADSRLPKHKLVAVLAVESAIACGTLLALYLPWLGGVETFGPVLYWITGPRLQNYWPDPLLMSLTAWTSALIGMPYVEVREPILSGFKSLARLLLIGVICWQSFRVGRALVSSPAPSVPAASASLGLSLPAGLYPELLAGSAKVLLVFLLLVNTWIMPWYYLWPLTVCAALGWDSMLVRICAGLSLTAPVIMYGRQLNVSPVGDWAGLTLVLPLVLAVAPVVARRVLRGWRHLRAPDPLADAAHV
ncbi:MAG: hypothetical protein EXR58_06815 [Chloroflexi bacterium]|nr:hypothetical protein [Chloroflexota bacterium]